MSNINDTLYYLNREQEEQHIEAKAKKLNMPYVNLVAYPIIKDVLKNIAEADAARYKIISYLKTGTELKVGVVNPTDKTVIKFLDELAQTTNLNISTVLISESSWRYGLNSYRDFEKKEAQEQDKEGEKTQEYDEIKVTDLKSAAEAAKKANLTKLLDVILMGAIKLNASDIHLEPSETDFLVRYRIDGVLQDVVTLPLPFHKQLSSRIKYLSKLRMDITNDPQDGRFSYTAADQKIDFRVSIMPSAFGEAFVMRLLGQEKAILKLDSLGFRPDALVRIKDAIAKPHGMVMTSGPTGSGKSSTLYAILMEVKKPGVKIITLEDPVEYRIEGIEQSQVRPGAGYEFADGLRASLRQDPDILMVGEIRDKETAEIAIQAALTGHLLLSTIHANSAPSVFARLLEIGVKPFLLSGSINLIMAQRLVRKICPDCKENYSPSLETWQTVQKTLERIKDRLPKEILDKLNQPEVQLVRGKGCEKCNSTGFSGRQVIVEILVPDDKIEALVAKSATIAEFEKVAADEGMTTMEQDGLIKAISGQTTIEEVWRVTRS
jgi:type IV pilus assembly protein PilB